MAEIGLIASVIQVAGAGLKLSQTLYQYADGVATADRRIKDIAKEIQLTSFVVEELGVVFKHDETSTLMSKNAVKTAHATMEECSTVFAEIDATLKKSKKNTFGKLMLPFRDNKIELLRNHIDKLKSTLQLLMQVLMHAHQIAAKKLDREAEAKQKAQIQELIELKKKSAKKYEESLKNFSISDGSTMVADDDEPAENEIEVPATTMAITSAAIGSSISPKTLETCVQHVRSLLEDIENLQQALSDRTDDHSEHHQSLIGSYFRARGHLDKVLFSGSQDVNAAKSSLHASDLDFRLTTKEINVNAEEVTVGQSASLYHSHISTSATTSATQDAAEQARKEEIDKLRLELANLRAEKDTKLAERKTIAENAANVAKKQESDAQDTGSTRQAPIKFRDTLGRTYDIPFSVGKNISGLYARIKTSFARNDEWSKPAAGECFDVLDEHGNVILPEDFADIVEPGMSLSMEFWPISNVGPHLNTARPTFDKAPTSSPGSQAASFSIGRARYYTSGSTYAALEDTWSDSEDRVNYSQNSTNQFAPKQGHGRRGRVEPLPPPVPTRRANNSLAPEMYYASHLHRTRSQQQQQAMDNRPFLPPHQVSLPFDSQPQRPPLSARGSSHRGGLVQIVTHASDEPSKYSARYASPSIPRSENEEESEEESSEEEDFEYDDGSREKQRRPWADRAVMPPPKARDQLVDKVNKSMPHTEPLKDRRLAPVYHIPNRKERDDVKETLAKSGYRTSIIAPSSRSGYIAVNASAIDSWPIDSNPEGIERQQEMARVGKNMGWRAEKREEARRRWLRTSTRKEDDDLTVSRERVGHAEGAREKREPTQQQATSIKTSLDAGRSIQSGRPGGNIDLPAAGAQTTDRLVDLNTPLLRVSRPVAACSQCRAAKLKCDGKLPACTACEKSNRASVCSFANHGSDLSPASSPLSASPKIQPHRMPRDLQAHVEDYASDSMSDTGSESRWTPTYSKAVHFNEDAKQERHVLQVQFDASQQPLPANVPKSQSADVASMEQNGRNTVLSAAVRARQQQTRLGQQERGQASENSLVAEAYERRRRLASKIHDRRKTATHGGKASAMCFDQVLRSDSLNDDDEDSRTGTYFSTPKLSQPTDDDLPPLAGSPGVTIEAPSSSVEASPISKADDEETRVVSEEEQDGADDDGEADVDDEEEAEEVEAEEDGKVGKDNTIDHQEVDEVDAFLKEWTTVF